MTGKKYIFSFRFHVSGLQNLTYFVEHENFTSFEMAAFRSVVKISSFPFKVSRDVAYSGFRSPALSDNPHIHARMHLYFDEREEPEILLSSLLSSSMRRMCNACSQHLFGILLRMNGMPKTRFNQGFRPSTLCNLITRVLTIF